jgi:hypothetical protein
MRVRMGMWGLKQTGLGQQITQQVRGNSCSGNSRTVSISSAPRVSTGTVVAGGLGGGPSGSTSKSNLTKLQIPHTTTMLPQEVSVLPSTSTSLRGEGAWHMAHYLLSRELPWRGGKNALTTKP